MNRYRIHEPKIPLELYYEFKVGDSVTLVDNPTAIGVVTRVISWKEDGVEKYSQQYDIQWKNFTGDGDNKSYGLSFNLAPYHE